MKYSFQTETRIVSKKDGQMIVRNKKGRPFILPSKKAQACEALLALKARKAIPHKIEGSIRVTIKYRGRADLDNVANTVNDSLQSSGRIKNDNQIDELHVYRQDRAAGCTVEVEEL